MVDPVVREAGQRAPGAAVAVQQLHLGPGRAARHQDGCGEEDVNDVKRTSSEDTSHGIMGRRFPDGGLLRYRK